MTRLPVLGQAPGDIGRGLGKAGPAFQAQLRLGHEDARAQIVAALKHGGGLFGDIFVIGVFGGQDLVPDLPLLAGLGGDFHFHERGIIFQILAAGRIFPVALEKRVYVHVSPQFLSLVEM